MIRVPEIKLYLDEEESKLKEILAKKLNISSKDIVKINIVKKSIDARGKEKIHFLYTLDAEVKNEEKLLKRYSKKGIIKVKDVPRPIIVGTGPSRPICRTCAC